MKRTRHVLVMTLVATALCADRIATAAPEVRAQLQSSGGAISRLATRLSATFRRVVPAARLHEARHERVAAPRFVSSGGAVVVHATRGVEFEFRLPPPLV